MTTFWVGLLLGIPVGCFVCAFIMMFFDGIADTFEETRRQIHARRRSSTYQVNGRKQ